LVKHEEIKNLYRHAQPIIKLLGYIPRGDRDIRTRIMKNIKHLVGSAALTETELKMLYGICKQIEKRI
jgi:tRNA C32,U32 (ribose-2'-O)-methylase TrmJ